MASIRHKIEKRNFHQTSQHAWVARGDAQIRHGMLEYFLSAVRIGTLEQANGQWTNGKGGVALPRGQVPRQLGGLHRFPVGKSVVAAQIEPESEQDKADERAENFK